MGGTLTSLVANRSHVPLTADLLKVSSETITEWVEQTYDRFCFGEAFRTDLARTSPAHLNLLLRIRDFATIIEAQRSMKEGDYGCLMFMWERWAVMTQGLGHMPHYSKHLPKLIVQLKYVLPKSISHLISNTLLLSPNGQAGHFMATDQYLEVLNYWLKYFFNHSGIGTDINRLKDVFSPNITIVSWLCCLVLINTARLLLDPKLFIQSSSNHSWTSSSWNRDALLSISPTTTGSPGIHSTTFDGWPSGSAWVSVHQRGLPLNRPWTHTPPGSSSCKLSSPGMGWSDSGLTALGSRLCTTAR
jgi:hypothetical protein